MNQLTPDFAGTSATRSRLQKTLAPYGRKEQPARPPRTPAAPPAERKTRSDKLIDIKIPVTEDEHRWLRTQAVRQKSNVTKIVSAYISDSILTIPILDRPMGIQTYKFVHARISQGLHQHLLDKAVVADLSIRQAARSLLNGIWKG